MGRQIEVTTKSGYSCTVDTETIANDMEIVDLLTEMDGSPDETTLFAMSRFVLKILGREQREKLYSHLRREDGNVPVQDVTREIFEIFQMTGTAAKK